MHYPLTPTIPPHIAPNITYKVHSRSQSRKEHCAPGIEHAAGWVPFWTEYKHPDLAAGLCNQ